MFFIVNQIIKNAKHQNLKHLWLFSNATKTLWFILYFYLLYPFLVNKHLRYSYSKLKQSHAQTSIINLKLHARYKIYMGQIPTETEGCQATDQNLAKVPKRREDTIIHVKR